MEQENIPKTPEKFFKIDSVPAGLTGYKTNYLFTPVKESTGLTMDSEIKENDLTQFHGELESGRLIGPFGSG